MAKLQIEIEFVVVNCCQCNMPFALTDDFQVARRRDHAWFYCPLGHAQHYSGKSDEEKLRDQLRRAQEATKRAQADYEQEWQMRKATERSLSATKGVLTRTKKRIARGVCPCCNRTFQNLSRHMEGQHPDYELEHVV